MRLNAHLFTSLGAWSPALKSGELLCSVAAAAPAVIVNTGSCFVVQTSLEFVRSLLLIPNSRGKRHAPSPTASQPAFFSHARNDTQSLAYSKKGKRCHIFITTSLKQREAPMTHRLHVITSLRGIISISLGFHKASSWLLPRFRIISTRGPRQSYSYKRIKNIVSLIKAIKTKKRCP